MNTKIEIHDNNTALSGTYRIFFTDLEGETASKTLSEDETEYLLNSAQRRLFQKGTYVFHIDVLTFHRTFLSNDRPNYYKRHLEAFMKMKLSERRKYRSRVKTMIEVSESITRNEEKNRDTQNRLIDAKQFLYDTAPRRLKI